MTRTLWFVIVFGIFKPREGLKCLRCDEISHPRFCQVVTDCGVGEVCFADRILTLDGATAYRLGCSHGDINQVCYSGTTSNCSECCNADLCNAGLCGERGFPKDRGPICYNCMSRLQSVQCNVIGHCDLDEVCHITKRSMFGEKLYDRGCVHKNLCVNVSHGISPGAFVGRRELSGHPEDTAARSTVCCDTDLCNNAFGDSIKTSTSTTNIAGTTTIETSPTTASTLRTSTDSTLTTLSITPKTTSTTSTSTTQVVSTSSTTSTTVDSSLPRDCHDIKKANTSVVDGVYTVVINDKGVDIRKDVYCDMKTDGGGWTVFQYRYDQSENFNRSFADYEKGFGQWPGELWLGLKWIYLMTSSRRYELSVVIYYRSYSNHPHHLRYTTFEIGPPQNYTLKVNGFPHLDDGLITISNGCPFTTADRQLGNRCAFFHGGGWWYQDCYLALLNGPGDNFMAIGNHASFARLRSSSMSIRPI